MIDDEFAYLVFARAWAAWRTSERVTVWTSGLTVRLVDGRHRAGGMLR